MTNVIATDAAKLELDNVLYFFDIEVNSNSSLRYHPGVKANLANVLWYDYNSPYAQVTYKAMPIEMDGEERISMGSAKRPSLRIGIVATTFAADLQALNVNSFDELVGRKVTRRITLQKYINAGSSDSGSGTAPIELPKVSYLIENITQQNSREVVFELATPFDTQGILIPHRKATANLCTWIYQGVDTPSVGGEYSACYWSNVGTWVLEGNTHKVYFNSEDEPIIPSTTSFQAWQASIAITKDAFYSHTESNVKRINANGTLTNVSVSTYWQATTSVTSSDNNAQNQPSKTNTNFRPIRVYSTYANGTQYLSYVDNSHSQYVISANKVWKNASTSTGETPGFSAFWNIGDVCGKKLNSCASRFAFKPVAEGSSNQLPSVDKDTSKVLPFGGFPGLGKKHLR